MFTTPKMSHCLSFGVLLASVDFFQTSTENLLSLRQLLEHLSQNTAQEAVFHAHNTKMGSIFS